MKGPHSFPPKIIIDVRGGVVQSVTSNAAVEVLVIDWDDDENGEPFPVKVDLVGARD